MAVSCWKRCDPRYKHRVSRHSPSSFPPSFCTKSLFPIPQIVIPQHSNVSELQRTQQLASHLSQHPFSAQSSQRMSPSPSQPHFVATRFAFLDTHCCCCRINSYCM
jgi:hypothetical protein